MILARQGRGSSAVTGRFGASRESLEEMARMALRSLPLGQGHRADAPRDAEGPFTVVAQDPTGQAVDRVVRDTHRVVVAVVREHHEHGTEQLVLRDLGVFVGAARESVNRQLQLWRKDGILDLQRGRILLQNMGKLTAVARNE